MGIDINGATFLCYAKTEGVSFESTATLGHQNLYATRSMLGGVLRRFGYRSDLPVRIGDYAEPLFHLLGARRVDSFDASDYEGVTVVHDFNHPIGQEWKNRYTAVLDGGTLEHVFDFPRAVKNAMEMIAEGGHYLGITPANNFFGHGFYQFSPELYFRIFSAANGFQTVRMLMYRDSPRASWYEVADPSEVRKRVTLVSSDPVYLAVLAQRREIKPIFEQAPIQSDYESEWSEEASRRARRWTSNPLVQAIHRRLPGILKRLRRRDPRLFRRVDLTRLASR